MFRRGFFKTAFSDYNEKKMPSSRCVVQDCSNTALPGISIHACPSNKKDIMKWVNFVKMHRANFAPAKNFVICSEHFLPECFHQMVPVFGSTRRLKGGSCLTIWKNISKSSSARECRQVWFILTNDLI